jgi:Spy/CpxP family protein refolding chaperone
MNNAPSWKVWVIFAGVFVAGAVAGGFLSLRVADRLVKHGRESGQFAPKLVRHFTEMFELTDTQQGQVQIMVDGAWVEMQEQRRASRETMQTLHEQIFTVLSKEQQIGFSEWQERQRKRWQSQGDRRGDGSRRGPDADGKGPPPHPEDPPPPPEEGK